MRPMRRLSARTAALVDAGVWKIEPAVALAQLAENGEPAALSWIVPQLLSPEPKVAQAARRAATAILAALPARDYGWLEQTVRGRLRGHPDGALSWWQLRAGQLAALVASPALAADGPGLLQLASFHPSGFVRAEAVRLLAEQPLAAALPCLLLRLNDWVLPVQQAARAAVGARLGPAAAAALLPCLALVEQLTVYRRRDLSDLQAQLRAVLLHRTSRPLLWAACEAETGELHQRRAVYRLLADAVLAEPDAAPREAGLQRLCLRAMRSPDLWLRVWAVRLGRKHLFGEPLVRLLGQARADRGRPVRREALLAFLDAYPALEAALCDPCVSLRELARYALRKKATLDFASYYCQILAACGEPGPRRLAALAGLGETGTRADAGAVLPFTADPVPKVRATALRALGQLDAEGHVPVLAAALADPSRRVVRAAAEAIGTRVALLGADRLEEFLARHPDPGCRRRIVDLMAGLSCWVQPRVLLRAARDPDPEVAAHAALRLDRWLAVARYVVPTEAESAALREELDLCPPLDGTRDRLRWQLAHAESARR